MLNPQLAGSSPNIILVVQVVDRPPASDNFITAEVTPEASPDDSVITPVVGLIDKVFKLGVVETSSHVKFSVCLLPATIDPLTPVKVATVVSPCCTLVEALHGVIVGATFVNEPVAVSVEFIPPPITPKVNVYDSLVEPLTP